MSGELGLQNTSLYFALWAMLRMFKFVPDKFVEQSPNIEPSTSQTKKPLKRGFFVCVAGELGFEPRLAESESAVLPLDDSPVR